MHKNAQVRLQTACKFANKKKQTLWQQQLHPRIHSMVRHRPIQQKDTKP